MCNALVRIEVQNMTPKKKNEEVLQSSEIDL